LDWSARSGAWILEDDYYGTFRYDRKSLPALQADDRHGRVIYLGTFSNVLAPALRMGFIVAPHGLVDRFAAARSVSGRGVPAIDQAVLAAFLGEGHLARHIRTMRSVYIERQQQLRSELAAQLAGVVVAPEKAAGMHVVGWLPHDYDATRVSAAAMELGIEAPALCAYSSRPLDPALVLGYGAVRPAEMRDAVCRLARAIERASPAARRRAWR
jgi:GntR family transcriptional regulator/MocR family aminotransferase